MVYVPYHRVAAIVIKPVSWTCRCITLHQCTTIITYLHNQNFRHYSDTVPH